MSETWKIAAVQMDCRLGQKPANQETMLTRLRAAAPQGARLVAFPECALTGYCYESKAEALTQAEAIPGPSTEAFTRACRELGVWAVYGLLERDGERLFNALALVGPQGLVGSYRKVHLPFLGVDRFATPGDRPFQVHDLGGLRVGLIICYDGSFPESARVLTLQGADLIVLPTNWPEAAACTAKYVGNTRAMENRVYYAAVNRVGTEAGFRFIGMSRIIDCTGDTMVGSDDDGETMLFAEIEPARARRKHEIRIPGKHEINRIADRRPEMYGSLVETKSPNPKSEARKPKQIQNPNLK
jgi:predicted amidohydrolase